MVRGIRRHTNSVDVIGNAESASNTSNNPGGENAENDESEQCFSTVTDGRVRGDFPFRNPKNASRVHSESPSTAPVTSKKIS